MMILHSRSTPALWTVLLGTIFLSPKVSGFVLTQRPTQTQLLDTTTIITGLSMGSSLDDELDHLEEARSKFEFLMQTEGLVKENLMVPLPHSPDEYTPRPLTEKSRERRELELSLLQSLESSDDGIEELMSLWMVERGPEAAQELQSMETLCSPGLVEEERILRNLMHEYGIHWAEPVSRLASLLYFKGNSAESKEWCEIALAVKPWHFEVVHTCVLNALRSNDLGAAVRWQRRALPGLNPTNNHKRRKAWVARAVKDAQNSLQKAKKAARESKPEQRSKWSNEVWQ